MVSKEQCEIFGERLDDAIRRRGIRYNKVAEWCGLSRASITHYIYGTRIPRIDIFMRIATYLKFTAEEMCYIMGAFDENS